MEIFKLLGKIVIDGADDAQNSIEKVGKAATKAGKVIAAGVGAGAAAVGVLAKNAVSSYADYEQLVGGVQTLFNETELSLEEYAASMGKTTDEVLLEWGDLTSGARRVMNNADEAFRNVGLSANEYMETVTSFSASLLQSLGGDTDKAAEKADLAITDMADNANKMGTQMVLIQNAYQGFAKQNYTMLDNLKLGYGGTKEEMERLLKKANELNAAQGIMTNYQIDSYADIVDAIHVVQTEMGITGTTAHEAATTIQGSLAMAKAAWQNLLTGLADGDQDLELLIDNLVDSVKIAADNVVPRFAAVFGGISDALAEIMPVVSAELPGVLSQLLPGLLNGATSLIVGLAQSLPPLMQIVIEQLPGVMQQICDGLAEVWPAILETIQELLGEIFDYISLDLMGTGVSFEDALSPISDAYEAVSGALQTVVQGFQDAVTWGQEHQTSLEMIAIAVGTLTTAIVAYNIAQAIKHAGGMLEIIDLAACWVGVTALTVAETAHTVATTVATAATTAFGAAVAFLTSPITIVIAIIGALIAVGVLLYKNWDTVTAKAGELWQKLGEAFDGIKETIIGAWNAIWDGMKSILNSIIGGVETMVNGIVNSLNKLIDGLNKVVSAAGKALGLAWKVPSLGKVSLPRLEKGGILEAGQMGFLEGNGAEAVVPLDRNSAWISAVAKDMEAAGIGGNSQQTQRIIDLLEMLIALLPDTLKDAFESMKFDINNREFARLVKAVN